MGNFKEFWDNVGENVKMVQNDFKKNLENIYLKFGEVS